MSRKLVLLDLDGTLVDSAPAILGALQTAFASCGVTPVVPLDAALIGPPLRLTIERAAGAKDDQVVERLTHAFRDAYDLVGYRETVPYPRLHEVLHALSDAQHSLALVTNKRRVPTLKILDFLNVASSFDAVYTVDSFPPAQMTKSQLVAHAMAALSSAALGGTVLVGDTREDERAAIDNSIQFVAVRYGYGFSPSEPVAARVLAIGTLAQLPAVLDQLR